MTFLEWYSTKFKGIYDIVKHDDHFLISAALKIFPDLDPPSTT